MIGFIGKLSFRVTPPDRRLAALATVDFTDNVYCVFNGTCIHKITCLDDGRRIELRLLSSDLPEDIERRVLRILLQQSPTDIHAAVRLLRHDAAAEFFHNLRLRMAFHQRPRLQRVRLALFYCDAIDIQVRRTTADNPQHDGVNIVLRLEKRTDGLPFVRRKEEVAASRHRPRYALSIFVADQFQPRHVHDASFHPTAEDVFTAAFHGIEHRVRHIPVATVRRDNVQRLLAFLMFVADGRAAHAVAMEPTPAGGRTTDLSNLKIRIAQAVAHILQLVHKEVVNIRRPKRLRRRRMVAVVEPAVEKAVVDLDGGCDDAAVEPPPCFAFIQ